MKKRILAAALVCAAVMSGCGSGTDLPAKYKGYMDYAFDGNYTAVQTYKGKDNGADQNINCTQWEIAYTDKNGESKTAEMTSSEYVLAFKKIVGSKKVYDDYQMSYFMDHLAETAAEEEFRAMMKEKYPEIRSDSEVESGTRSDGYYLYSGYYSLTGLQSSSRIKEKLDTESGRKVSELGLAESVSDPYFVAYIVVKFPKDTTDERVEEVMNGIYDHVSRKGTPMNLYLSGTRYIDDKEGENLWKKVLIMGEETELEGKFINAVNDAIRARNGE